MFALGASRELKDIARLIGMEGRICRPNSQTSERFMNSENENGDWFSK